MLGHLKEHSGKQLAESNNESTIVSPIQRQPTAPANTAHLLPLLQRSEFSNPVNDSAKARLLGGLQRQFGNCFIQRALCPNHPAQSSPILDASIQLREGHDSSTDIAADAFSKLPTVERGGGEPLNERTRAFMERRFGQEFNDVRVHTDSAAEDAARQFHARAFTTGRDIYFGTGRYQPHTREGEHLLAHELTHVVQQRSGAIGSGLGRPSLSTPGDAFEREADAMANRVMDDRPVSLNSVTAGQAASIQCAPLDDVGGKKAAKERCDVPVNYRQTAASGTDDGVLHFKYAWDSSSGKLSDIGDCQVGELVEFPQTEDPPFARRQDPAILWRSGGKGLLEDDHFPALTKPYKVSTQRATQFYRYRCHCAKDGNPINLRGPISIVRQVSRRPDGKFKYTIKKSGKTAEIDPLP